MLLRRLLSIGWICVLVFAATGGALAQDTGPGEGGGGLSVAALPGTGFTYQGELRSGGTPVTASCDFQFSLFDAVSGGTQQGSTQTVTSVTVANGRFTVTLNSAGQFGARAFDGSARWLAIAVRCPAGGGGYTSLSPRQPLSPSPLAFALPGLRTEQTITSTNVIGGHISNTVSGGVYGATISGGGGVLTFDFLTATSGPINGEGNLGNGSFTVSISNTVTANFGTIGGGLRHTASGEYATIGGGLHHTASGESATVGGGSNNTASGTDSTVGGGYNTTASGSGATVAGGYSNAASNTNATVAGGYNNTASGSAAAVGGGDYNIASGQDATVAGGYGNVASGERSTIGGGNANTASGIGAFVGGGGYDGSSPGGNTASGNASTIGGGQQNAANGYAVTVAGGYNNVVTSLAPYGAIGGGQNNTASDDWATIGGGQNNIASNQYATVAGGANNTASGFAATVAGGYGNTASGGFSFAAGADARAIHNGAFVWADQLAIAISSTVANQYLVRASGGISLTTNSTGTTGCNLGAGGGTWACTSDRNAKENFAPVNGVAILNTLAGLPIETWNFNTQDASIRHMGPMAQDWHALFGLGEGDTTISAVDADGVALAAIQGLYTVVQEKDAALAEQSASIAALSERVRVLEAAVETFRPAQSDRADVSTGAETAPPGEAAGRTVSATVALPWLPWALLAGLGLLNVGGLAGYALARKTSPQRR